MQPAKGHKAEEPELISLDNFWTTSRYCRFCSFLYNLLSKIPDYTSMCRRRDPNWTCKLLPRFFAAFVANARSAKGQHFVVRRFPVNLVPRTWDGPHEDNICTIQAIADDTGDHTSTFYRGRVIDTARIQFNTIKTWIKSCQTHHGSVCTPLERQNGADYGFRLVDIRRRCVVTAPPECRYTALSYTWGDPAKVRHLTLNKNTFDELHTAGALSDQSQHIPTTIKHALTVTERLDIQYLWIDAICIQQDDESDKANQIPHMDSIYGAAVLTIVAGVGSDAWAGLPRVLHDGKSQDNHQAICCIGGVGLISVLQTYHSWRDNSTWDSRGWTFQEKVLSKRLLIFGSEQVYFQCKTDLWCEDTICENLDRNIGSKFLGNDNLLGGRPDTHYNTLVANYTHRNFSFQSDVLKAFSGLENLLRPTLSSEFCWGLPISIFDTAISWTCPYHYPGKRRLDFPSWSWSGWDLSGSWEKFGVTMPQGKSVGREVLWHRLLWDEPSTNSPFRIVINSEQPAFVLEPMSSGAMGDLTYKSPPNKTIAVTGPLPTGSTFPPISHILQFWTESAFLRVGRADSVDKRTYKNPVRIQQDDNQRNIYADIHGLKEKVIGHIRLHRDWRPSRSDKLEFIIISRFHPYSVYVRPGEEPSFDSPDGFYLLLIERIQGIAYRVQAPFRPIAKADWMALKREWKLITLA